MRNLILVLLAAGAVAFVGYVFLKTPPPSEPDWDTGRDDPAIGAPEEGTTLVARDSRVIRPGHVEPGDEVDWTAVMETEVLLDAGRHKTGGALLDAVEKALGKKMPIRFVSQKDEDAFRGMALNDHGAEGQVKHHLPDIIEIVRGLGYVLEPRERFMIFRRLREDERPPGEQPPR